MKFRKGDKVRLRERYKSWFKPRGLMHGEVVRLLDDGSIVIQIEGRTTISTWNPNLWEKVK